MPRIAVIVGCAAGATIARFLLGDGIKGALSGPIAGRSPGVDPHRFSSAAELLARSSTCLPQIDGGERFTSDKVELVMADGANT